MNERFKKDRNSPTAMEVLNKRTMYGATRSATSIKTEVRIGSGAEDLSRSGRISELTSSTVEFQKVTAMMMM